VSDPAYMSYDELVSWVKANPIAAADWIQSQVDRNEPTLAELLGIGLDDD
jgi:hypothetical protein